MLTQDTRIKGKTEGGIGSEALMYTLSLSRLAQEQKNTAPTDVDAGGI